MTPTTGNILFEVVLPRFRTYGRLIYFQIHDVNGNFTDSRSGTNEAFAYDDTSDQLPLVYTCNYRTINKYRISIYTQNKS